MSEIVIYINASSEVANYVNHLDTFTGKCCTIAKENFPVRSHFLFLVRSWSSRVRRVVPFCRLNSEGKSALQDRYVGPAIILLM